MVRNQFIQITDASDRRVRLSSRPHTARAGAAAGGEVSRGQLAAANGAFKMVAAKFQISAARIVCTGAWDAARANGRIVKKAHHWWNQGKWRRRRSRFCG